MRDISMGVREYRAFCGRRASLITISRWQFDYIESNDGETLGHVFCMTLLNHESDPLTSVMFGLFRKFRFRQVSGPKAGFSGPLPRACLGLLGLLDAPLPRTVSDCRPRTVVAGRLSTDLTELCFERDIVNCSWLR